MGLTQRRHASYTSYTDWINMPQTVIGPHKQLYYHQELTSMSALSPSIPRKASLEWLV